MASAGLDTSGLGMTCAPTAVEAVMRGDDVARLMPLVQHHLDMCPDCREEFEALLRAVQAGMSAA